MRTKPFLKKIAFLLALVMILSLSACGSDPYTEYVAAYNKLTANGGIDANIRLTLEMNGESMKYAGNFKVDNKTNTIYYEMSGMSGTTTQFSDGSYLYTIQGDNKMKYSLTGEKTEPVREENKDDGRGEKGEFESSGFLDDFASLLEARKIKELGLLSPIEKAAVIKTTKTNDVYTLQVADAIVQKFLNTMATEEAGTDDTVQLSNLKDFAYTATVKNGVVTGSNYSCSVTVNVPGSLMSDGKAVSYSLKVSIVIDFVNPGQAVTIDLPSTEGFKEVQSF